MKTTYYIIALRIIGTEGTSKPSRIWLPNLANQLPCSEAATTISLSSLAYYICQDLDNLKQSIALSLPLKRKKNTERELDQIREARRGQYQGKHNNIRRNKDG